MEEAVYENGVLCVTVSGEIDHHGARMWRTRLDDLVRRHVPNELILDLHGVAFMDSAGLGLILGRYRQMCTLGGTLTLRNAPDSCVKMLRLSGADTLIRLEKQRKDNAV